jgi:hypothetical protein
MNSKRSKLFGSSDPFWIILSALEEPETVIVCGGYNKLPS